MSDGPTPLDSPAWQPERLVVAVGGLVASGKSALARALAARLGAACIEADHVRNAVLVRDHAGDLLASLDPGVEAETYDKLLRLGAREVAAGRPLVLDACFPRRAERLAARELARSKGRAFLFVESRTAPEVRRARLGARDQVPGSTRWQDIHDALASHYEPFDELDAGEHLVVSGEGPVGAAVDAVVEALQRLPLRPLAGTLSVRPEVVTFDCWNTLLVEDDWHLAHALRVEALRNGAVQAGSDVSREEAVRAFDVAWQAHMEAWNRGHATGAREVAIDGLRELGVAGPHPALEHLVEHFEVASHSSHVRALEGAAHTLAALCESGIQCALICDTGLTPGRVVRLHLDRLGMLERLAVQIFSDEIGVPKPHTRVFRAALEPLGVQPGRAVHVGDLRRTDVAGSRAAGMASIRIRASYDDQSDLAEADFVVHSHAELRALLALE